jgi:CRP-like cAMP-binding protein
MARDEELRVPRERFDAAAALIDNAILKALPEQEIRIVRPYLEPLELDIHDVLQHPGEKIEYGFFLNSGLASLFVVTSDARSVEVGIVGREGFVGSPLVAGVTRSQQRAVIQVPARAFRIKSENLELLLPKTPLLKDALNRYVLVQGMQVAQLAACNRLHEIEQRLARWLLMTHDRVGADSFPITHDMLAQMLGSGRPSITVAAGALQRAGTIEYSRGVMKILSRPSLEAAACECYAAIRRINATGAAPLP